MTKVLKNTVHSTYQGMTVRAVYTAYAAAQRRVQGYESKRLKGYDKSFKEPRMAASTAGALDVWLAKRGAVQKANNGLFYRQQTNDPAATTIRQPDHWYDKSFKN